MLGSAGNIKSLGRCGDSLEPLPNPSSIFKIIDPRTDLF